ncbi:extracellular solute-binding protein [Paenibacillus glycanilyticus]|uniref:extracellular solute-binding protein n=1 Tax=Paenibacillus glycanilyticus TaxID=126569 RepID=UPI002041E944|nr:extracellular solute-binding protein [Paenibacillus glycanilyticus]MCM3631271.1 extracellular solute-binding protein [Paenibacillus glycanilyticus]
MRRKRRGLATSLLALSLTLTACTSGGGKGDGAAFGSLDREDKGTLKIGYFNEEAFYMQYGNAFQAMFPNVELEVISTEEAMSGDDPVAAMESLIEEQQPDAVLLTEEQYADLAQEGKLYDLDAAVKQDSFDIDGFLPSVIDLLKARGGGKLYGLSPSFSSQALYYNKDLFDKYGVPYPTDGMSWDEVLQLAARFPVKKGDNNLSMDKAGTDDALYGLSLPMQTQNSFELVREIGEAKGLLYADSDAKTVSFDTPEWKAIVQTVVDGYESGSITTPPSGNGGQGGGGLMIRGMGGGKTSFAFGPATMRFMNGQAAMTVDGPMLMNMMGIGAGGMKAATKVAGSTSSGALKPLGQDLNWDVVSIPTDPSQQGATGSMSLDNIFAINASSENLSAAWEFLKYANGEQLAKTSSKSSPALSSRTAYKNEADGKNIDAFYNEKINEQALLQENTLPDGFAASFETMAAGQLDQAVQGTQSVDDALKKIQSEGQDLLTKALADEAAE